MIKPCRIHLPKTQEELAECLELDRLGLAGHGDSPNPTPGQIAAYEEKEKSTQGKIFLQSEMKDCLGDDFITKGENK